MGRLGDRARRADGQGRLAHFIYKHGVGLRIDDGVAEAIRPTNCISTLNSPLLRKPMAIASTINELYAPTTSRFTGRPFA